MTNLQSPIAFKQECLDLGYLFGSAGSGTPGGALLWDDSTPLLWDDSMYFLWS